MFIAITGDLINSDRRLDEMLNMSVNRSQAVFLAVDLLQQVIHDIGEDYAVSVACVTGNESRLKQEWGWTDFMASDKFGYAVECKKVEKINIWKCYEQATENSEDLEPLLIFSKNNSKVLVCFEFKHLLDLVNQGNGFRRLTK